MKSLMIVSAVAVMAAATDARATDPVPADTHQVAVAGVEVTLDRHGRMAPLADEQRLRLLANLRAQYAARGVAADDGPLRVGHHGEESMVLGLRHERITVARIGADGALEMTCVRGDEAAARVLATTGDH